MKNYTFMFLVGFISASVIYSYPYMLKPDGNEYLNSYQDFIQQAKLVGTNYIGSSVYQGSVALSADGNTLAVGGHGDNSTAVGAVGATWLFIRSPFSMIWNQQAKLVATDYIGNGPFQGWRVSLSADGNILAVSGPWDNHGIGATWMFTRSGTQWTQQAKLIGTDYIDQPQQGDSISLSADGNTLAVSGPFDNSDMGATWIFIRSGTTWSQQAKLIGTNNGGQQGWSVALSADGNTLAVGGPYDSPMGATWIFTRSGTTWSQQAKLVGTNNIGESNQGWSVALSADGNTLAASGPFDNSSTGATWIFIRSGTTWSQQAKLVGTESNGSFQGNFIALSADGNMLAVGGPWDNDNYGTGATWIFTRGTRWTQQAKLVGTNSIGDSEQCVVALSADGSTLAVGGPADNSTLGATWIFIEE